MMIVLKTEWKNERKIEGMILNDAEKEVIDGYFEWLVSQIDTPDGDFSNNYGRLMHVLFDTTYTWEYYLNENRAVDGMDLRGTYDIRYATDVEEILKLVPCTVLECLVALFVRCSDEIIGELDDENAASELFYDCLRDIGLLDFDDSCVYFDEIGDILDDFCDEKVDIFKLDNKILGKKRHDLWYMTGKFVMENWWK